MIPTYELFHFLDSKCSDYCCQMNMSRPVLYYDKKKIPTNLKRSISQTMRYDKGCKAIWYPGINGKADAIYIDIQRNKNRKDLENTLVHEMLHSKLRSGIHDKEFYKTIKLILHGKTL